MTNETDLSALSDEQLMAELAKRRAKKVMNLSLLNVEEGLGQSGNELTCKAIDEVLEKRVAEQNTDKTACPYCNKLCLLKRKNVRRELISRYGEHEFSRHYYYCSDCRKGFYPLDKELGLPAKGRVTPGLEKIIVDFGMHSTFEEAAERVTLHHNAPCSENLVRRVIERVGEVSEHKNFAENVKQKSETKADVLIVTHDGSFIPTRGKDKWREVKLGMIYRHEKHHKNGKRGFIQEARYVAKLGKISKFGEEMQKALALERSTEATRVVVIGDGAPGLWNLADELCYGATEILDYYHAMEHAHRASQLLFDKEKPLQKLFIDCIKRHLFSGQIAELISEIQSAIFGQTKEEQKALKDLLRYYTNNAHRMKYDEYQRDGLPIGSGCIESAHKHVLQKRMKLAGQHWDPSRADKMARLRAALATCGPAKLYHAIQKTRAA